MRVLLVDGHYYLYRSFFAIRGLKNSRGEPTNAIFAFTKALRKMLADIRPTHGAVLWDAGLPAHRVALQPEYKQQRDPMPDELAAQEPAVMDLCPLLGLPSISVPNTEADDLIAAYAAGVGEKGEVVIATSDKDILQLANERIRIYSTAKADLAAFAPNAGYALLGPEEVTVKWGVPPHLIGDVLALTGDNVDNIPGVPGVGEKTAAALIREFGSVDQLLAQLAKVGREALREKLENHIELIRTNQKMVRLQPELPLPQPLEELALAPRLPELLAFLRHCEFRSLSEEVAREVAASGMASSDETFVPSAAEASSPPAPNHPRKPVQGELF
jgi:5'-3' exonuclease